MEALPDGSVERIATAYHEAGHCAIAMVQKIDVLRVTIVPDPANHRLGYTRIGKIRWNDKERALPRAEQGRLYVERMVRQRLAGGAAERRLMKTSGYSFSRGDNTDRQRAELLLGEFAKGDQELARNMHFDLDEQSIELVAEHWPKIEALAQALLARHTMERNDLVGFFAREERAKRWAQY